MTVGLAEDLGGRPYYDDAEFSFRASAGSDTSIKDGMASIKELHGNSVVWNQLRGNAEGVSDDSKYGLTILTAIDSPYISIVGTPTHDDIIAYNAGIFPAINGIEGHKYVGAIRGNTHVSLIVYGGADFATASAGIFTCISSSALNFVPQIKNKVGVSINEEVAFLCYDLTLMFGAGNEPVTIDEFYARMPIGVDMSAYNEGEVIHLTAEGIKSIGDNAWDEEWEQGYIATDGSGDGSGNTEIRSKNYIKVLPNERYFFPYYLGQIYGQSGNLYFRVLFYDRDKTIISYTTTYTNWETDSWIMTMPPNCHYIRFYTNIEGGTYNNDIMISLVHSGWKQDTDAKYQPYWDDTLLIDQRIKDAFPEGLQKWDKVYNKNGKGYIVKGTGKASNLDWGYTLTGDGSHLLYVDMVDVKPGGNVLCAQYEAIPATDYWDVMPDKAMCIHKSMGRIIVKDSAYTDAASFKAAMAGVMLYYELATPEVIEYDEPFNLDYRVADFGTEEVISDQPSAPIAAEIQYNFNANDTIRTNRIAIHELKTNKQDTLVSGENIKTINGESILGSGDIVIEGGETITESDIAAMGFTKNTGTYSKPSGGIPKTDLASAVQTSLGKADTALQSYTEQYKGTITGVSANGTSVATSGVADIPAASLTKYGVTKLSDATDSTSTTLAATASAVKAAYDLANNYKGTVTGVKINGTTKNPSSGIVDLGTVITSHQDISGKQDKLVSGTNIKTVNGQSLLGSGDITISSGSNVTESTVSG